MKVNLGIASQNSADWERIIEGDHENPPQMDDWRIVEQALALGDLAEPLGFDGIWVPEHFGTPYGMTPNPLQLLAYFAGRTQRVSFGTQIVVVPWWNPMRLIHQIAYLDIISNGRYQTIGLGRGVAKSEFDALGIPRETSMKRFEETIDILELAFTKGRFSYEGEVFRIPETEIRPAPKSRDLFSRLYGASATGPSLEMISRRGVKPLFVGNKPLSDAADDVRKVNTMRREVGLPPCQPKNILFTYCVADRYEAEKADEYLAAANRDVALAYGLNDPSNFAGVKGYESYAARASGATAPDARAAAEGKPAPKGYDQSNLMIGTPDIIIERIIENQKACSFSEITLMPQFGTMPYSEAARSVELFAREVLPAVHEMEAPLHPSALPEEMASDA
ncbi:LLM class flavin-dependent oxidoreductase [Novosphingobium album (ex Hu et al. 2023)]|uniref:LLM class flavin-dependent oxidoreductase n=1 Tax=Novosphingobium album (ex Hu et al. 2023) TaxID=2930093 RepID=A0ABT0B863_9SPHN|nr:LLM class flavin-dependent oxidoreductase [Novosphingobium album (ex Hu et al. 2023)]MCJ2181050.1 LLM class flavin-dependent oxidoreductase [Novosphingobium album (ex Hu et al. 2023)]